MKPILSYELLDFTKRGLVIVVAEDLTQAVARYNEEFENQLELPKRLGRTTALCIIEANRSCTLLFKASSLCASTICHEVTHATNAMLDYIGIKLTNSTDEVYAYHNDMLFRKVCKFLEANKVTVPLLPIK
jgi:hypothetical protein